MDTGTHLKAIWQRRWQVVAAALLAALAVFTLRASSTTIWTSEASLFLAPAAGAAAQEGDVARLTAAYVELIFDPGVSADAVRRDGGAVSLADLTDLVEVSSTAGGEITVSGHGLSAGAATTLTNAVADALSVGARADQVEALRRDLDPLDAELASLAQQLASLRAGAPDQARLLNLQDRALTARIDQLAAPRARLDVVRRARAADAQSSPNALRDAVLAFLLVAIVAAEVAAVRAARRQGLDVGDPVQLLGSWTSLPVFRLDEDGGADQRAAALRFLDANTAGLPVLYLAPLNPTPATQQGVGRMVEAVFERYGPGEWTQLESATPSTPPQGVLRPDPGELAGLARRLVRSGPLVISAPGWESEALLDSATALPGVCLLVVDVDEGRRPLVQEALRVLSYTGLPPLGVLVVVGRSPSRWRRGAKARNQTPAQVSPSAA